MLLVTTASQCIGVAFDGVPAEGTLTARQARDAFEVSAQAHGGEPPGFVATVEGLPVKAASHGSLWALADRVVSIAAVGVEVPTESLPEDAEDEHPTPIVGAAVAAVATSQLGLFQKR